MPVTTRSAKKVSKVVAAASSSSSSAAAASSSSSSSSSAPIVSETTRHILERWIVVGIPAIGVAVVLFGLDRTSNSFGAGWTSTSKVFIASTGALFGAIVLAKILTSKRHRGVVQTQRYITSSVIPLLIYTFLGAVGLWTLGKLVDQSILPALDQRWNAIVAMLVALLVVRSAIWGGAAAARKKSAGANISLLRKILDSVRGGGAAGGEDADDASTAAKLLFSPDAVEPAPMPLSTSSGATTGGESSPHWEEIFASLRSGGDTLRLKHLESLHRLFYVAEANCDAHGAAAIQRTVQQECVRLAVAVAAERCNAEEDAIDGIASLLDYGFQKLPELFDINYSDLLLFKVMQDINSRSTSQRTLFVDHRQLRAFHPIDHLPAVEKCEKRAACARRALPALRSNGMKLSSALIMANEDLRCFRSLTGFQIVRMNDGVYVTFEGNGRREALARAFGGKDAKEAVQIECTLFEFDDEVVRKEIVQGLEHVRKLKKVVDT